MTNDTDSFVQEVDQSLREDALMKGIRRYGPWVAGALVVFIIGLFGWQLWSDYQLRTAREHADDYVAAQELARAGSLDGAKAEFERLSSEGPRNYRVMARMERAAILETQGDLQGALAEFDAAAEAASDPVMRETAQLRAAYIAADTQDFEALQFGALRTRVSKACRLGGADRARRGFDGCPRVRADREPPNADAADAAVRRQARPPRRQGRRPSPR